MESFTISVPYRFTCEHCAKGSGLQLMDIYCSDDSKNTDSDEQKQKARNKCEQELTKRKEKTQHGNYIDFDGRCPHCGKHQSWDAGPLWDAVLQRAFGFAAIPAVLAFILFSLGLKGTGKSIYSVPIALGVFLGFSVLLTPVFLVKWLMIRKDSIGIPQKNVPEIDWDNKGKPGAAVSGSAAEAVPQPLSPQQLEEQVQSLIQTAQARCAKIRTSGWLLLAGGVLSLVLPSIVFRFVEFSLALSLLFSFVRVGGIAMLISGILRLRSLKRVKSFCVPDNARGYVVASNARARLVAQHASGWFCHKCGACNPVGNDACFCCGTAYDAVQSENTYRQALERYSHVINMMK